MADEDTGDTPVEEWPADETPVGEEPADETPVGEGPAGETPVGEEPAGETPVEEGTIGDAMLHDDWLVTLPPAVRDRLDVEPGDELRWTVREDGALTVAVVDAED